MDLPGAVPTRRAVLAAGFVAALGISTGCTSRPERPPAVRRPDGRSLPVVALPPPRTAGGPSLHAALAQRRSVRSFAARPLETAEVGQLLWAAQGVTASWGGRTAPSAGALYPLEVYAALPTQVLHYLPEGHRAEVWATGDARGALADAAASHDAAAAAPAIVVMSQVVSRTAGKYAGRAGRYADLEAGHAVQNLLLEAVALGMSAVPLGAFEDDRVARQLLLPASTTVRYLIPVGGRA